MLFCFRRKVAVLSDEGKRKNRPERRKKTNENINFNDQKFPKKSLNRF